VNRDADDSSAPQKGAEKESKEKQIPGVGILF